MKDFFILHIQNMQNILSIKYAEYVMNMQSLHHVQNYVYIVKQLRVFIGPLLQLVEGLDTKHEIVGSIPQRYSRIQVSIEFKASWYCY